MPKCLKADLAYLDVRRWLIVVRDVNIPRQKKDTCFRKHIKIDSPGF